MNGVEYLDLNPLQGFYIEDIPPLTTVTVTFEAIISCCLGKKMVCNEANIHYDYIYHVEEPPIPLIAESNTVKTHILTEPLFIFKVHVCQFTPNSHKVSIQKTEANLIFSKIDTALIRGCFSNDEVTPDEVTADMMIEYELFLNEDKLPCQKSNPVHQAQRTKFKRSIRNTYVGSRKIKLPKQTPPLKLENLKLYLLGTNTYPGGTRNTQIDFYLLLANESKDLFVKLS
ncbi:MAG: hypothetical protein ACRCST_11495 [Turicibacter sp.]